MAATPQGGSAAKTYVLVHGGFHGGWCWQEVAALLRAQGHTVYTPTLTGLGERSHLLALRPGLETFIEDIAQVIRFENLHEVVLVGHSFAGSVVSALADRMPERLHRLVYLDANVMESGGSSAERAPERVAQYRERAMAQGGGLGIPPPDPAYFGIEDAALAEAIRPRLTLHPLQTYFDRLELRHPLGNGVPATFIACTRPLFPAGEPSRQLARARGWQYLEIATGHDAMLLAPRDLAALLAGIG